MANCVSVMTKMLRSPFHAVAGKPGKRHAIPHTRVRLCTVQHCQKKKKNNKKKAQGVESALFGTMSAFGCIDNVA